MTCDNSAETRRILGMLPQDILEKTEAHAGADHLATLLGERTMGSKWGREMTRDLLVSLPWEQVPSEGPNMLPFCQYFRLGAEAMGEHFPGSSQRCEPSSKLPRESIRVVEATHDDARDGSGIRVHDLVSDQVKERSCSEAWLIVGPASKEDQTPVVWTLFPGELFGRLPPEWDGDLDKLDLSSDLPVKGL